MLQKITDNLFYLFIFLLPWQTVFILREPMIAGEKWQYGMIGVYLVDIILLAWLLLVLCGIQNAKCKNQNDKLKFKIKPKLQATSYKLRALSCLVLWSFASIFWSADSALAFYFSLKLLLAMGLFFALQKIKINWRKIVFVFLAAAVLQSVLGIGQFLAQDSFSSKWLGMNSYEVWQGGVSVLENEGGRWLRAYGSLPHPNILGGYLAVVFLLGVMTVNGKQRTKNNKKNRTTKLFILSGLIIILLGILLTFSRGAWLALIIGIIFLGAGKNFARKNFVKLLLILGLAGIIFIGVNHENFSTRFDAGKRLEQKSISERNLYFSQAKEIIGENFWLGTGAGNYTLAVFQKDEVKKPIWQYQPVHNVFALIWAELGIVGLVLFLIILISLFISSYQSRNSIFPFYIILATLYLLLLFDHWLWTTHFGILLFWLIAGLVVKLYKTSNKE